MLAESVAGAKKLERAREGLDVDVLVLTEITSRWEQVLEAWIGALLNEVDVDHLKAPIRC